MQYYLLLCRSITHAQRMTRELERIGVYGRISRPPSGLTEKGCSYGVRVGSQNIVAAIQHLTSRHLQPERIFIALEDGGYREIVPQ